MPDKSVIEDARKTVEYFEKSISLLPECSNDSEFGIGKRAMQEAKEYRIAQSLLKAVEALEFYKDYCSVCNGTGYTVVGFIDNLKQLQCEHCDLARQVLAELRGEGVNKDDVRK